MRPARRSTFAPAARLLPSLAVAIAAAFAVAALPTGATAAARPGAFTTPIRHIVVLYQENHSFNDLLGALCVREHHRCHGTTVGEISDGQKIPLFPEPDLAPAVGHTVADQVAAIHGGHMNGWDHVEECGPPSYLCLTQAGPGRVPTLWKLADNYVISDRTFETNAVASWGSHLELVAATMDGFVGDQPSGGTIGPGGGCDSQKDEAWTDSASKPPIMVPSCVPNKQGKGPYRSSPVKYVPTIMDSMDAAGLSWSLFTPAPDSGVGYGWAICPTFYECLGSSQAKHVKDPSKLAPEAMKGTLPNLSIVVPDPVNSQHNSRSLMEGDNWIASSVKAIMQGPDWNSTAIFITYDDCGCFYDPAQPPPGSGVRVPMVIVSPYAKQRFVDHTDASFASLLAFTEHAFGLNPLPGGKDATAYDYMNAFAFDEPPRAPIDLPTHRVPPASLRWLAVHPPPDDDPT
jgi:phospholipase C